MLTYMAFLVFLVLFILFATDTSRIVYVKKLFLPLVCVIFILLFIAFSRTSLESARKGLDMWLNTVFPSLFPFLVVSEILRNTGFVKTAGVILEPLMRPIFNVPGCSSFAYALGVASGYPVGAKITSNLFRDGLISKNEAERLLAFSNNSGPLFITGAVATGILGLPEMGILLLSCHIAAGTFTGVVLGFFQKKTPAPAPVKRNILKRFRIELLKYTRNSSKNIGTGLSDAVSNSIGTLLLVGGFIILFSVIINLLISTGIMAAISSTISRITGSLGLSEELVAALVGGIIEITTGSGMIGSIENIPVEIRLSAIALIMGWGGISVHFQVYSIAAGTGIKIRKYVIGKAVHGLSAAFFTFAAVRLFSPEIIETVYMVSPAEGKEVINGPFYVFFLSCRYMTIALLVLGLRCILVNYTQRSRVPRQNP